MSETFSIDGTKVLPGQNKLISLLVSPLPSGTPIHINVHVYRSKKPGPSVLLLGGLHGDEINGVETVRRVIYSKSLTKLKRGTVIAIPLLNVFGFINFSREVPDGKDVNRSFPGSNIGSLASRVAHVLTKKILPLIDFGIDFHTGGSSIFNYPQLRVTAGDEEALNLAKIFNPPFILQNKVISKSLRKQAHDMGKSMLVFEGGESQRIDEDSIVRSIKGIDNVLGHLEMTEQVPSKKQSKIFEQSRWLRAPKAGVFILSVKAGSKVKKGDLLGEIHNLNKGKPAKILAPFDSCVLAHVNNPVISRGDALFHLVY
jgi:predicted deacylase